MSTMYLKRVSPRGGKRGPVLARILAAVCLCYGVAAHGSAGTIVIGGTGSALGTMHLLSQSFESSHPGVSIKIAPSLGSSGGIKALRGGALQIAVTSRNITAEDRAAGLSAFRYGTTAFVFVSQAKSPKLSLTKALIADIYSGKQANWPNHQPIRLVLRPQSDSDSTLLDALSPEIKGASAAAHDKLGMIVAVTDTDAADQIEKIPDSFGTSTLALLLSEGRKVTLHALDGVTPSAKSLADGSYGYTKEMFVVTSGTLGTEVQQFVDFIRSPQGAEILTKTGHRPN